MSITNSVATPGVKDEDLEHQAPKNHEEAMGQNAVEGKVLEPMAKEMAAVSPLQHGAEQVSTITHTTLTNQRTRNRTQNYPVGPGREKSVVAYFHALVTGIDATNLSDADAAELNDIDSYLSSMTQKGACTDTELRKMLSAENDSDPTLSWLST